MNFQEAEKTYKDLHAQHDAGKLTDAQFETEVGKLRLQDDQGRWWQIGVQTGEWYMHDGQKWNKAKPPTPAPAAPPVTPPPPPVSEPVKTAAPVPAPAPAPKTAMNKNDAQKPEQKQPRASALPRLISAKPAGREGGLSRPMLIGIIAAVAVIIILLLVGGYFLATNVFGTASAKPTSTATRALVIAPTSAVPSRAPTVVPTNTPELPPTAVVTATTPLTTTAPTATRAPSGPTATRKPAGSPTPTVVKGSPTPNLAPGVYVTKVETDPPKLNLDPSLVVTFKVTMFNNTGSVQTFHKWFVRIFTTDQIANGAKNSYGESLKADVNVAPGTSVITTQPQRYFGPGQCSFTAIPYYTEANEIAVPFQATKGGGLYYDFNICQ